MEGVKGAPRYGARRGEMSRRMSCYVKETIRSVFKANLLNVLDGSSTT